MKLKCIFNLAMRKSHRQSILLGHTMAMTPEQFFGFRSQDVESIHLHKQGVGEGIWFRLRCGRVVDELAVPTCRDPDLYDQLERWG